jgi:hypothetical protein
MLIISSSLVWVLNLKFNKETKYSLLRVQIPLKSGVYQVKKELVRKVSGANLAKTWGKRTRSEVVLFYNVVNVNPSCMDK